MQKIVIVANGDLTGANPCLTACGWPLRYESGEQSGSASVPHV